MSIPIAVSDSDVERLLNNQVFLNMVFMQKYARLLATRPVNGCKHCWEKNKRRSLVPIIRMEMVQHASPELYAMLAQHYNAPKKTVFKVASGSDSVILTDKGKV